MMKRSRMGDAMRRYSMLGLAICALEVGLASPAGAVDGAVTLTCSAPSADLRRAIKWARTTTASNAFAACLDQAMRKGRPGPFGQIGPYRPCAYTVGGKRQAGYLDPFFGSGTVGVVAIETDRRCVGVEAKPDYVKIAKNRIMGTNRPLLTECL